MMHSRGHLPPRELWPTILRTRSGLQYPERSNLTAVLLDQHVDAGAADRPAVLAAGERVTYGELQRRTNRIGHALRAAGVQPGDRVAMRFLNNVQFVATWLAVQKVGAVGVSTMPMLRARELAYVINDSEARLVLCQNDLMEELARARPSFDHPVVVIAAGRAEWPRC